MIDDPARKSNEGSAAVIAVRALLEERENLRKALADADQAISDVRTLLQDAADPAKQTVAEGPWGPKVPFGAQSALTGEPREEFEKSILPQVKETW